MSRFKEVHTIFDDVAEIFNSKSVREIRRITGLSRSTIYNLRNGCPFSLNYDLIFALQKLGFNIKIYEKSNEMDT